MVGRLMSIIYRGFCPVLGALLVGSGWSGRYLMERSQQHSYHHLHTKLCEKH